MAAIFCWLPLRAQANAITLVTLNCYWFFGEETYRSADKPKTTAEYELKAGHLVGLLPAEAPLLVGLQEIGNGKDIQSLANSASRRYRATYQPLFVQGRDTATKQDVGAILNLNQGWGVYGKPSRPVELDDALTKHLVMRLTNAVTSLDVCVVHLRRPIGADGEEKQRDQCRALLRWVMRHQATNPKANVVILGDFNEGKPVGSDQQTLAVLFAAKPPMLDVFTTLPGKVRTHAGGGAYDRILVSEGIRTGASHLKYEKVEVIEHRQGKGDERRVYTDHFPVVVRLNVTR